MNQDLKDAFDSFGISITEDDVLTILRIGADKYLSNVRFNTNEENMSEVYIILSEMREQMNFYKNL